MLITSTGPQNMIEGFHEFANGTDWRVIGYDYCMRGSQHFNERVPQRSHMGMVMAADEGTGVDDMGLARALGALVWYLSKAYPNAPTW